MRVLGRLQAQFQLRSVVPFLVACAHCPFSFPEPSAEPMPFIVRVAKPVGLLALRTLHRLLVEQRVAYRWAAIDDFG
jgi:hypothetical protein